MIRYLYVALMLLLATALSGCGAMLAATNGGIGTNGAGGNNSNVGLQIGKGQYEIGNKREDLRNVGRRESRNTQFLPPDLRRPHGVP